MMCTFCTGVRLINRGDKRIKHDTILRRVQCPNCGTVKTYEKVYPKSFVKKWKIIPSGEGMVVNPKIITIRKKGSYKIEFGSPESKVKLNGL